MVFRSLAALGRVLAIAALAILTLLVAAEVLARSLFAVTLPFGEELGGYLLIAVTFLAAADSFASGGFMRVDLLFERLPPRTRRHLDRVLALVGAAFSATVHHAISSSSAFRSAARSRLAWRASRLVAAAIRATLGSGDPAATPAADAAADATADAAAADTPGPDGSGAGVGDSDRAVGDGGTSDSR